jgi:hypothetical protein
VPIAQPTARPQPLTAAERRQIAACAIFLGACTARCEHRAVDGYLAADDPNSFTSSLRQYGTAYLAHSGHPDARPTKLQ